MLRWLREILGCLPSPAQKKRCRLWSCHDDYGNILYLGVKGSLERLQLVLIPKPHKFATTAKLLHKLHCCLWGTNSKRCYIYKLLLNTGPQYLRHLVSPYKPHCSLRSSNSNFSSVSLVRLTPRRLCIQLPRAQTMEWNISQWDLVSLSSFWKQQKTWLSHHSQSPCGGIALGNP